MDPLNVSLSQSLATTTKQGQEFDTREFNQEEQQILDDFLNVVRKRDSSNNSDSGSAKSVPKGDEKTDEKEEITTQNMEPNHYDNYNLSDYTKDDYKNTKKYFLFLF